MDLVNKKTILNLINENKNVLFGKFSNTLTHEMKTKKWKEITEQIKAMGIFEKDWRYLRDTTWQNWRKRTVEKRDNRCRRELGGVKKYKYDDSEEDLNGSKVSDGSGCNKATVHREKDTITPKASTHVKKNDTNNRSLIDLRGEKLKAEILLLNEKVEIAKREKCKLDLEIMKLENELHIRNKSEFTLLHAVNDTSSSVSDAASGH